MNKEGIIIIMIVAICFVSVIIFPPNAEADSSYTFENSFYDEFAILGACLVGFGFLQLLWFKRPDVGFVLVILGITIIIVSASFYYLFHHHII